MDSKKLILSKQNNTQFAVIGLGRFGFSLANKLFNLNCDVLAIDSDENVVNNIIEFSTHAICADASDENVLKSIGIQNFDVVVVCIGSDMQASILVSLMCKQMGVKKVIAKAQSNIHKLILEKIGADIVILPEEEMGVKTAIELANPNRHDLFNFTNNFKVTEISAPRNWIGKSLKELAVPTKYNVSILLIKKDDTVIFPDGNTVLEDRDAVVLGGPSNAIEKLAEKI